MCAYPSAPFRHFLCAPSPPNAYGYGYPPAYPQAAGTESAYVSMQQCYRRANEYLIRALEIDESGGENIWTAVDLYSKAVGELENGIFYSGYATGEEAVAVESLRKKMMTNLDNARDRVNFLSRDIEMRMQPSPSHQCHPPPQTQHLQSSSSNTCRDKQFNKHSPKRSRNTNKSSLSGDESRKDKVNNSKKAPIDNRIVYRNHSESQLLPAPADSLQQPTFLSQRDKDTQSPRTRQSLPDRPLACENTKDVDPNRKDKTPASNSKKADSVKSESKHNREESPSPNMAVYLQVPSVIPKDKRSSLPQSSKSLYHASPSRKPHRVDTKKNPTQKGQEKKNTGSKVERTCHRRAPTESTKGNGRQPSFKKSTERKSANPVTGKNSPSNAKVDNKTSLVSDLKGVDKTLAETILEEVVDSGSLVTTWDDIVGLQLPKQMLKEIVILPALRPEALVQLFTGLRSPCRGLLLFGPPGNGKTMLAKAVAHESQAKFFNISASSLTSKWLGDGERLVKALFALARKMQPSVIFLDEVDALLSRRGESEHDSMRRLKNEFLQSFDGMHTTEGERILVMAATNRPQELDDAALRRFGKRIYIPLPGLEARRAVLENLISKHHHSITEGQMEKLAEITEGYSGSDLKTLASDASLGPIRELDLETLKNVPADEVRPINIHDFEQSLPQSRSSVSHDLIKTMEEWNANYGVSAYCVLLSLLLQLHEYYLPARY